MQRSHPTHPPPPNTPLSTDRQPPHGHFERSRPSPFLSRSLPRTCRPAQRELSLRFALSPLIGTISGSKPLIEACGQPARVPCGIADAQTRPPDTSAFPPPFRAFI